jgi:tRNA nucleotidyltransferase (CCA-adding enzyme)
VFSVADVRAFPERLELPAEVIEVARTLEHAGHEAWVVGGALRDLLIGAEQGDLDLATSAPPEVVQSLFRHTVPVGIKYGTVGVLDARRHLHEVTTFRRDVETDGRHAVVSFGVSLEDDLARRDFTINAIAYHPLRLVWADPHHGREDLRAGVVRAVGDPSARFREDYLRILRAIRFAARFGFEIESDTWRAAVDAAPGLAGLSAERVRDEWFKGLQTAASLPRLVDLWHGVRAAVVWLPDLFHTYPGSDPAPPVRDPVVLTALACADAAAALRRLRASNHDVARAAALMARPHAPGSLAAADVRRWMAAAGSARDDLLLLERYRTGADAAWADAVRGIVARGEATALRQLALTGSDLLALGLPAGPAVGVTLERLLDLVLEDPSRNTRDQLVEAARQWK